MIHPTDDDVKRRRGVVYLNPNGPNEDGVITSANEMFVFVRYRGCEISKATRREDLNWLLPEDNDR